MTKKIVFFLMILVSASSYAAELKKGKTYTANVDMCVYETVAAAKAANKVLALPSKYRGLSPASISLLQELAKDDYEKYVSAADEVRSKNSDLNGFLQTAVSNALVKAMEIKDEDEKKKKVDMLNNLAEMAVYTVRNDNCKMIGYGSKFEVLGVTGDEYYIVKIVQYYEYYVFMDGYEMPRESDVVTHSIYYLNVKHGDTGVKTSDFLYSSFSGLTSGPLIIPFKYRTDDKSISGEVTVGYYAGYAFQITKETGITPMISAGLSQISVAETTGTGNEVKSENRTGLTWAVGLLLSNWDGVNIGLVYGQDRIGDNTWEHEGESWLSFSIGWDL